MNGSACSSNAWVKIWKQPKYPQIVGWINELQQSYSEILYENKLELHPIIQLNISDNIQLKNRYKRAYNICFIYMNFKKGIKLVNWNVNHNSDLGSSDWGAMPAGILVMSCFYLSSGFMSVFILLKIPSFSFALMICEFFSMYIILY